MTYKLNSVSLLGMGKWGTALACYLARQGVVVNCWDRDKNLLQAIKDTGINQRAFPLIKLPSQVKPIDAFEDIFNSDIIILVFSSAGLSDMADKLSKADNKIIVTAMKGIEKTTCSTPINFLKSKLNSTNKYVVVSGPSFANDVILEFPCSVVVASESTESASLIAKLFASSTMRVYLSNDPLGVELGGILKNIIAIAVGVCDGVGFGDSARAALITRGLAEMTRLAVSLGAQKETLYGLSGLGDLTLTATCDQSRNRSLGLLLGKGRSLKEALLELGSTVEGAFTANLALSIARKRNIDMPLTEAVSDLLNGKASCKELADRLLARDIKYE